MKLLTTFIILILTFALVDGLYATDPYENLLTNPGFENGLNGWNQTGGRAYYEKSYSAHSGNTSAKGVETYRYNLGRLYQDLTGKLRPGKRYKIGGWIKTRDVKGQVVIALDYVNSNGWCTSGSYIKEIGYVTGNTQWQYFESNWFLLPQMPGNCSMLWFLFDFNNGEGTAWFDDVFLYEQSSSRKEVGTKLTALEKELYKNAMKTINKHKSNLARITVDCIMDAFSLTLDKLLENDDFINLINRLAEKLKINPKEIKKILESKVSKQLGEKAEEWTRDILYKVIKDHLIEQGIKEKKKVIDSLHQEILTYISNHAGEFSADRIKKCEEGLTISIKALKEAQKIKTGSWNPFERLPFVYLGYRPCQINRVSMAVCGYDWADGSNLANLHETLAFKIPGWQIGFFITEYGLKPGIVLAAFLAIETDIHNIYAGYDYTFLAIKGIVQFHNRSHLIDDTRTTPFSLISSAHYYRSFKAKFNNKK